MKPLLSEPQKRALRIIVREAPTLDELAARLGLRVSTASMLRNNLYYAGMVAAWPEWNSPILATPLGVRSVRGDA